MAPHSSTLAWKIPWMEEPGRLKSMGSWRVGHDWVGDFTFTFHFHTLEKEMTTHSSVLAWRIPGIGEPGRLPSMGSHRVEHDWSDLAAAAIIVICNKQPHLQQQVFISHSGVSREIVTIKLGLDWLGLGPGCKLGSSLPRMSSHCGSSSCLGSIILREDGIVQKEWVKT